MVLPRAVIKITPEEIKKSRHIFIPFNGGEEKFYSEGFNKYTSLVNLASHTYGGLIKGDKRNFIFEKIIKPLKAEKRKFYLSDSRGGYTLCDLENDVELKKLTTKVMNKISSVVHNNQKNSKPQPEIKGRADLVSSSSFSASIPTKVASVPVISTDAAKSNNTIPSPKKKRKTISSNTYVLSQIHWERKEVKHLGFYNTKEEAEKERDNLVKKHDHGQSRDTIVDGNEYDLLIQETMRPYTRD